MRIFESYVVYTNQSYMHGTFLIINDNVSMCLFYKTYMFYLIAVEECSTSALQAKAFPLVFKLF